MKQLTISAVLVILVLASGATARADVGVEFDMRVLPSIDEEVGYGTGVGVGAAVAVDLFRGKSSQVRARVDCVWQKWNNFNSEYLYDTELEHQYTRVPIFAGVRWVGFPGAGGGGGKGDGLALAFYADTGVDISFDTIYMNGPYVDDDTTDSSTNIGAALGGGLLIRLGYFELTFGMRRHLVEDAYTSINALGLALRFGALKRELATQ